MSDEDEFYREHYREDEARQAAKLERELREWNPDFFEELDRHARESAYEIWRRTSRHRNPARIVRESQYGSEDQGPTRRRFPYRNNPNFRMRLRADPEYREEVFHRMQNHEWPNRRQAAIDRRIEDNRQVAYRRQLQRLRRLHPRTTFRWSKERGWHI